MRTCKTCDNEVKGSATICKACKMAKFLDLSEKDGTIKEEIKKVEPVIRQRDKIPNIRMFSEVTLYAYQSGHSTYRYSTQPPTHTGILWEKKMSGTQAHQFLVTVKNRNRLSRLESRSLPTA